MNFIEVTSKKDIKEFILLPVRINKGDPNWIRPLDKDIEKVFDKKQNKLFRKGEAIRWILKKDDKVLGRIAAFYNTNLSNKESQPTGGVGFYDSVDDQEVANALFDKAIEWLKEKGMEAADGPINFGDRNNWWGLLVKGFLPPNYSCNYNPPYYQALWENYGWKTYFEQYTYFRETGRPVMPSLEKKAERVFKNPDYHFEHMKVKNWEKYAEDFSIIYNAAWSKHGVGKIDVRQAKNLFKSMRPILDEEIIWYGYYKDEPVCFFIMLPEINQLFKHVNGKLDLIGKLKFLYHKKMGHINKMFGVVFGVVPSQQGKGLTGAIVKSVANLVQTDSWRYQEFEMNWIGDFNPSMIKVAEEVGGDINKVHITYRYLFDRNKEFKRHPILK